MNLRIVIFAGSTSFAIVAACLFRDVRWLALLGPLAGFLSAAAVVRVSQWWQGR